MRPSESVPAPDGRAGWAGRQGQGERGAGGGLTKPCCSRKAAKGVGESPNVGGVPAFSNAVVDAFAHLGVTHLPMPHTPARLWRVCQEHGLTGAVVAAE